MYYCCDSKDVLLSVCAKSIRNYLPSLAVRDVTRQKNGVDERGVHPCFNIVSLFEEIGHGLDIVG